MDLITFIFIIQLIMIWSNFVNSNRYYCKNVVCNMAFLLTPPFVSQQKKSLEDLDYSLKIHTTELSQKNFSFEYLEDFKRFFI